MTRITFDLNPRGWWGDEPPCHVPVFEMEGGTTFTFIADGTAAGGCGRLDRVAA